MTSPIDGGGRYEKILAYCREYKNFPNRWREEEMFAYETGMTLKELFDSPDKWCKGNFAKDKDGNCVGHHDENAVRWCLLGGCLKCLGTKTLNLDLKTLNDLIAERTGKSITAFNDDPNTTFNDILEVLNEWGKNEDS